MPSLWSNEENEALLYFLSHNQSRDSFGSAMFDHGITVWNEVAKSLPRRPGIRRSAMACCKKWRWMKGCYAAISEITERFGWDDKLGANIGDSDSKRWEIFLTERMSISGPTLIRAASQFRNSGWNLLEKVTRMIEGPANEPEEEVVVRRPKPKLIPEVVIIRQPEHATFRHHLASIKGSEPCKPRVPKFKFKEELDPEISLFTPPPEILLDKRNSKTPEHDIRDFPQRITKRIQSDSEIPLPLPPAKRLRHSSPILSVRLDETIEDSVTSSHPVPADTDLSVRKSRMVAIQRVQALETQLSDRCIVALIDLFETKAEAADVYLSLTRESVRKQWVAIRVKHIKEQEEREGLTS